MCRIYINLKKCYEGYAIYRAHEEMAAGISTHFQDPAFCSPEQNELMFCSVRRVASNNVYVTSLLNYLYQYIWCESEGPQLPTSARTRETSHAVRIFPYRIRTAKAHRRKEEA
jgi:hypothetical protein